jgi:Tol biopolymer transport system component
LPCFHLSTDGGALAYVAKLDEGRGLFALPVSGSLEPKLLVNIESKKANTPQWSPDGSQLAYADGNSLYVIPAAGGQPLEVAHLPDDTRGWDEWTVRWSPDGKFIAALGYPKPGFSTAVLVVPASGGEMRQLTPDGKEYLEGVEWHPDGQRLSYNVCIGESETRQAYMDGRPPTTLVDHPDPEGWDYIGAWAPDGRRFFYMSEASGKKGYGVYVYDEASGDITLFADHAYIQSVPRWSRDGKTAAWYTTRETEPQAWVMENFLPEPTAAR